MRVYVHDVTGHVGSTLVSVLAEAEHEVVGSVAVEQVQQAAKIKQLTEAAPLDKVEQVNNLILSADAVVFPAEGHLDHTRAAMRLLKRGGYEGSKVFVLVSSLMTWAKTKVPVEDAESGLKEENFPRRKAAAAFSDLKTLESQTKALAKENLSTVVVAPGLVYGNGEGVLHTLFRQAWLCDDAGLPIVHSSRAGANVLPMIHARDLANIVTRCVESPPDSPYVVAVDKSRNTLRDVVTAVSKNLGTGVTRDLSREETQELLLTTPEVACMNVHLTFDTESGTVPDMGIEWVSEDGVVANIEGVVKEYKEARDLRPVRIVVMGAPAAGGRQVAEALARKYYVPLVTRQSMVSDLVEEAKAEAAAAAAKAEAAAEGEEADGGEEEDAPELTEAEQELAALREEVTTALQESKDGSLDDVLLSRVAQAALSRRPCQNQGWVLVDYPKSWREACGVWADGEMPEEAAAEGDEEAELPPIPEAEPTGSFAPSSVVTVDGDDTWLEQRAMQGTGCVDGVSMDEGAFKAELEAYRKRSADDNERSPASFFEAVFRVDTLSFSMGDDTSVDALCEDAALAIEQGGKPFNYHPTPEEEEEALRVAAEKQEVMEQRAREAAESRASEERQQREERQQEQAKRLSEIQAQENELLESRSAPLRAYLMKHVIPTLTEGLIETCKVMPEDPIDYLAEFMFKAAPSIDSKARK